MRESAAAYELKVKFLLPERIVLTEHCDNTDLLLHESPRQPVLGDDYAVTRIGPGGFVVLDFGTEIQGAADITVKKAEPGACLRIVYGESVPEAMSSIGEKNATNDHALRDFTLPVVNWQHFQTNRTGFRFLKLEAVGGDVMLAGIQAAFEYRDVPYKGSFECNDELLNRIWKTGAYTVHLNMQEYLWDGIKRDRLVWVGDMHPEISTIARVFGSNPVVPKSLDLIRDVTPPNQWMNGIPSYTMWWIRIQRDWFYYTGNTDYLNRQKKYLFAALRHILDNVAPDGSNHIKRKFVDWSSNETPWSEAGLHAMIILSLQAGKELCEGFGNSELVEECAKTITILQKRVPQYSGNKQIAALVALAGLEPYEKINLEILKPGGAKGLSTFLGYYTLQATGCANDMDTALGMIRGYWGKMIELGATTFWEYFDLEEAENAAPIDALVPKGKRDIHGDVGAFCYRQFRNSLCHGWASGPTAFLSEYVLGVKIIEPGYQKVKIVPQLGDLKWVRGKCPTPYGDIRIEHERINDKLRTNVELPPGIKRVT